MTAATVASTPVATEVKLSAGDVAIAAAAVAGANVGQLLKAVWSTRGFLRVDHGAASAYGGLGIIKSDLTGMLKALPPADPAPYLLVPVKGGAMLVPVEPAAEEDAAE